MNDNQRKRARKSGAHAGYSCAMANGGNFIQSAIKRPGQLHRDLGVPQGQDIPVSKIRAAASGDGKTAQRARFALTLRKLHP